MPHAEQCEINGTEYCSTENGQKTDVPVPGSHASTELCTFSHPSPDGERPVIEQVEDFVLQKGASFSEHGYGMHGFGRPVTGHKPGQGRIAVGHLDWKGQVTDVLEKTQEHGDVVILEITFPNHQVNDIQSSCQRTRRDGHDLKQGDDADADAVGLSTGHLGVQQHEDNGHDERDHLGNRKRAEMNGQALEVLLDERLIDLGEDDRSILIAQEMIFLPLLDHIPQPLLPQFAIEIKTHGTEQEMVQPILCIGAIR